MRKLITVFAVILILGGAAYLIISGMRKSHKNVPAGGGYPEDFIAGVKENTTYRLSSLLGRYNIVLLFLDSGIGSDRVLRNFRENLLKITGNRKDLVWLNITRDSRHAEIEEQTSVFSLRYRCLLSDFPAYYNFSVFPSVLIIDKSGSIKLVYNGYSPTIFADISAGLQAK